MAERKSRINRLSQKRPEERETLWRTLPEGYQEPSPIAKCPNGQEEKEWIAAEAVGFFNSLTLLIATVLVDMRKLYTEPGEGFPPGFTFIWVEKGDKKDVNLSSPEYIATCLEWMGSQFNDKKTFPTDPMVPFPPDFIDLHICKMFTLMFRVYAILYNQAYEILKDKNMTDMFNTALKHFVFFGFRHNLLIETNEFRAMKGPMRRLQEEYIEVLQEEVDKPE